MRHLTLLLGMTIVLLSVFPFAIAHRMRSFQSHKPRIHVVPDMDKQARYNPQSRNPIFADGRAMRPPVEGTIAREDPVMEDFLHRGIRDGEWAREFPMPVTFELLERGRQRFNINCAVCHGYSGHGDGMVARRAEALEEVGWTPPTSLHDESVRDIAPGLVYNTITRGVRRMPAMGHQITVEDRWAITAYVLALQESRNASADDLPPEELERLRNADGGAEE